jgi:hexokinase
MTRLTSGLAPFLAALTPSPEALRILSRRFTDEMARGLAGEGSLRMLPTFAAQPCGDETGEVLVVDWGGTHGRVGRVALRGRGALDVRAEETFTFTESEKTGSADPVFDGIAAAVGRVIEDDRARPWPLALIYSFPARLEGIDRAVALAFSKGWRLAGLLGRDVATLLHAALARRGLTGVRVRAVANDTVAPLVLHTYRARGADPAATRAEVGLILGTGTNLAADLGPDGIRNLESGNFDGVAPLAAACDETLDRSVTDPPPGAQRFEKMVAGHYLGEVVRRAILDLAATPAAGGAFRWEGAAAFRTPFGLDTTVLSRIEADASPDLTGVDADLRALGVRATPAERQALRQVARAVVGRSAALVAAALLGTLRRIDPGLVTDHVVAVDGSLYGGYPGYDDLVRAGLTALAGSAASRRIRLVYVKDSTAAGAAVVAAVAARAAGGDLVPGPG